MVSGPTARATPQQTVNFTCKSHGFSPRNITLRWFKNGNELTASQTTVYPDEDNASYSISSTTKLVLAPGDVRSQVICEVAHVTLQGGPPLRGTANLSETLRGRRPSPSAQAQVAPKPRSLPLPYSLLLAFHCLESVSSQALPVTLHLDVHSPPLFPWQLPSRHLPRVEHCARQSHLLYHSASNY